MAKSYSSSAILKHLKAGAECACSAVFETCHANPGLTFSPIQIFFADLFCLYGDR